jgi:hypothetical protein
MQHDYYDFSDYFDQELDKLEADTLLRLSKMVTLNKVTEQKTFDRPAWKEELSIFRKINIKPAVWQKSYRLDSAVKVDDLLTTLHFSASDSKTEIHRIELTDTITVIQGVPVYKRIDAPNKLIFHQKVSNSLTESTKILVYLPGKGFIITGNQKTSSFKAANYRIQGVWHRFK